MDGMLSEDHRARFRAEREQLSIRMARLEAVLCDWDDLPFEPRTPYRVLLAQHRAMAAYDAVLGVRELFEGERHG